MSNLEELNYAIISELRDQLEAKEQMIKKRTKQLDIAIKALDSLRGICFPERAERALKEIEELDNV